MDMATTTENLAIVIRAHTGQAGRISVDLVRVEDGEVRGLSSSDPRDCIRCTAYVGHSFSTDRPENEVWGWSVQAENIYHAGASDLEAIAKVLRTIERKMAKMAETEGAPETFGQYANRFGRAMGATRVCQVRAGNKGIGGLLEMRYASSLVDMNRRENFPTSAERAEVSAA